MDLSPLLVLLVPFALLMILRAMAKPPLTKQEMLSKLEKVCPPHKWRYDELKDEQGKVVRTRIVCDYCGPLKPLDVPERMDY